MKRFALIAFALLVGLLLNTLIFWGDERFLSPFIPVFAVALLVGLSRVINHPRY